jgi:polar amino acid transport system substrate-binding protein
MRRIHCTLIAALVAALVLPAWAAGTLDKVKDSGKLVLGYRADTRPFAFSDGSQAAGYSVELCRRVADALKAELKLPSLNVEYVAVSAAERFDALAQGRIDLSCGTDTPTLQRRATVDFSIPIFMSGIGAVVRADSPQRLRDVLAGRAQPAQPVWRAAPGDFAQKLAFAVIGGTTVEKSLIEALKARRIEVTTLPVPDYAAGIQAVLDRRAAALFGDRPVLLDAAQRGAAAGQLTVIERSFTREPMALAMRRGDTDLRLLVDRTLSRLYRSGDFAALYGQWFGTPDPGTLELFRALALPD